MNTRIALELTGLGACEEAVQWAATQKTRAAAWKNCKRGDWMLWFIGRRGDMEESIIRKKLALIACKCARLALKYVEVGELRPLRTIEMVESWARGENNVTLDAIRYAASSAANAAAYASSAADAAAYAAAADAAAYAATAASSAAVYAAYAAYDAAYDAAYAAYAAYDAAYAAANDANDAKQKTLAQCANIVREFFPKPPVERRDGVKQHE